MLFLHFLFYISHVRSTCTFPLQLFLFRLIKCLDLFVIGQPHATAHSDGAINVLSDGGFTRNEISSLFLWLDV